MNVRKLPLIIFGLLLFLLFLIIDLKAVKILFDNDRLVILVGLILTLETIFIVWYEVLCQLSTQCTKSTEICLKSFYITFMSLSAISTVLLLTSSNNENLLGDLAMIKWLFGLLFMILSIIGVRLIRLAVNVENIDTILPEVNSSYGKAGYKKLKNPKIEY